MRTTAKIMIKSLLAASLLLGPVMGGLVKPAAAASSVVQSEIQVYVDGEKLKLDPAPVQEKGTTLVPMRPIFQALGAQLTWEQQSKTVIAKQGYTTITLQVGAKQAVVNSKSVPLDVPAKLVQGTTMVPLRFVGEALGAKVKWNQKARTVELTSAEAQLEEYWNSLPEAPEREPLTAVEIAGLNDDKVVMIQTDHAQGSGVVIGDRLILTNYHVMTKATNGTALTLDGKSLKINGIVASDEAADLAVIQTSDSIGVQPVEIGDTYDLEKGDRVIAIGSPYGLQNTVSEGLISNFLYEGGIDYLQINAPIDHGSSGGALFNEYGELIGITTWKVEGSTASLNFAVSAYHAELLLYGIDETAINAQSVKFLPSDLPDSLLSASTDEIAKVMDKNFDTIQTVKGKAKLRNWQVTRDAQGWIVITANIDPSFYMIYAEAAAEEMRYWTIDAVSELKRMLPDQKVELIVYYEQTFDYEPRGLADNEITMLEHGKWKVRYPVIHAQIKDRAHIDIRA
ncbi:stalk domain-containing protein [Paenibacillus tarimensis]